MNPILVNAVTVHVKYWEELVRFGDLPGVEEFPREEMYPNIEVGVIAKGVG